MNVVTDGVLFRDHIDELGGEVHRVAGRELHALHAGARDHAQQLREGREAGPAQAVRVHVLAQQRDLAGAGGDHCLGLGQDGLGAARDLGASRLGHHAVRAVVVTAAHDRQKACQAAGRRREVVVQLGVEAAALDQGGFGPAL